MEATPISGPQRRWMTCSAIRVASEPGTLQIVSWGDCQRCRASRIAPSVSIVSPDCEIETTSTPGPSSGSR